VLRQAGTDADDVEGAVVVGVPPVVASADSLSVSLIDRSPP